MKICMTVYVTIYLKMKKKIEQERQIVKKKEKKY